MTDKPIFAFVTIGSGSYLGSTVRDLTVAKVLHRRGFKVAIYWMMEWMPEFADLRDHAAIAVPRHPLPV